MWSGRDAVGAGLVDALGGLARAVAILKDRAGIAAGDQVRLHLAREPESGAGADSCTCSVFVGATTCPRECPGWVPMHVVCMCSSRAWRPGLTLQLGGERQGSKQALSGAHQRRWRWWS